MQTNPNNFTGFTATAATFEMYKIKHVKVSALPAWRNGSLTLIAADALYSPLVNASSTYVATVVDYTSNEGPVTLSILGYNNVKINSLSANGYKTVASYVPRIETLVVDNLIRSTNIWCSTASTSQKWNGCQIFIGNAGGATIWSTPTRQQLVQLLIEIEVEFKQPAIQVSPLINISPMMPQANVEMDEDEIPPEDKISGKLTKLVEK